MTFDSRCMPGLWSTSHGYVVGIVAFMDERFNRRWLARLIDWRVGFYAKYDRASLRERECGELCSITRTC